ncbi:hypothetical protein EIP86_002970 [Pleurotus ostreatoroseus]|nr:hypothetical protein EIP86_002970 [Pleurotus ostreatoroseus]
MSPGSAVEQVKTRFSKLKRSSSNTLHKLRHRKSSESRHSTGSLADAALGVGLSMGSIGRSLSVSKPSSKSTFYTYEARDLFQTKNLKDASISKGSKKTDDNSSVYSYRSHASSSESLASDTRGHATEVETNSVGSGSHTTSASESTFPHTPENSFKNPPLPSVTEDKAQVPDAPATVEVVSDTSVSVPEIMVDATNPKEGDQGGVTEDIVFATVEDHTGTHLDLPTQPSGLSLLAGPLDTIYEVDSVVGSHTGLSAFPSTTSQCNPSPASEISRDETCMPADQDQPSQQCRPAAPEPIPSELSFISAVSGCACVDVQSEGSRAESPDRAPDTVHLVQAAPTNQHSDLPSVPLEPTTEHAPGNVLANASPDSSKSSDVFLAREGESAISLDPNASRPCFPALPTDNSLASSDFEESERSFPGNISLVESLVCDNTGIEKAPSEVIASDENVSHSFAMSNISGIEYLSAEQVPAVRVVDSSSVANVVPIDLNSALAGVSQALASLPSGDRAVSLFASNSSLFTTSTPASRSCVLPQDDGIHPDVAMCSHSESATLDEDTNHTDAFVSASSHDASGNPPNAFEEPSLAANRLIPSVGQDVVTSDVEDSTESSFTPKSESPVSSDNYPLASGQHRSLATCISACARLIFAVVGRSMFQAAPYSYLGTLPPILRLYTVNRSVFLTNTPFVAPSLVDSLSYSWHADDVD